MEDKNNLTFEHRPLITDEQRGFMAKIMGVNLKPLDISRDFVDRNYTDYMPVIRPLWLGNIDDAISAFYAEQPKPKGIRR